MPQPSAQFPSPHRPYLPTENKSATKNPTYRIPATKSSDFHFHFRSNPTSSQPIFSRHVRHRHLVFLIEEQQLQCSIPITTEFNKIIRTSRIKKSPSSPSFQCSCYSEHTRASQTCYCHKLPSPSFGSKWAVTLDCCSLNVIMATPIVASQL